MIQKSNPGTLRVFSTLTPGPPERVGEGQGRAPAAAAPGFWPRSHGLLISSAFQAARGNAPFKVLWLQLQGGGLQEIACGAKQAEGSVTRL